MAAIRTDSALCLDHLKKNKNYRRYASSVERALSLFDTALQEWADYISFLSRLLKASINQSMSICGRSNVLYIKGAPNPSSRPTSCPPQDTRLEAVGPMLEPLVTIWRPPESY